MEKFNVWKILALISVIICVGCTTPRPHSAGTGADANNQNTSGSSDAQTGAGTGTGGTETESSGTGNATSGAGTGTGGTDTSGTGK